METLDIIVLGKKLGPYGIPSSDYKNRLDKAVEIYRANLSQVRYPRIIITGGIVENRSITEARAGFEYLKSMYFQYMPSLEEAIRLEEKAIGTIGNAVFTKLFLLQHGIGDKTLIVTSDYHIKRAEFVFNYVYGVGFNLEFIASDSGLEGNALSRIRTKEEESLRRAKNFFKWNDINPGEHKKILEFWKGTKQFFENVRKALE